MKNSVDDIKQNINVVTVRSGWILQKIAQRIVDAGNRANLAYFELAHVPKIGADVNFYCDVQNCFVGPTNSIDVGLFTHVHENNIDNVSPVTYQLDYIFHMARRYRRMFIQNNKFPSTKMGIMRPWEIPDGFEIKKPIIGIFQRGKYKGKGHERMAKLFADKISQHFRWLFVGNDWDEIIGFGESRGLTVYHSKDKFLDYPSGYSSLYDKIDYLLIPSEWEGGPMCALEATAKGIPIISSNVGWVSELPLDVQIYNNFNGLIKLLSNILIPLGRRRDNVDRLSYKNCARQIVEIIR